MKKFSPFLIVLLLSIKGLTQNLQLHYDFRHSINPKLHSTNFPSFSFEYFKQIDTLGTGSFLLKAQADLNGKQNNVGQVFVQVSQTLRFWKPKIFLSLNYSGGVGATTSSFGYYIANAYGLGISYPFQWKGAWLSTNLQFRYNAFDKPSYDPQFTFYFGKGIRNYRFFAAGSFVFWTQNKNQGNSFTGHLKGKKFAFFGDPQFWVKIKNAFSVGSRFNVFYHVLSDDKSIQVYPTLGIKYQF
jgi:hypothetical protein